MAINAKRLKKKEYSSIIDKELTKLEEQNEEVLAAAKQRFKINQTDCRRLNCSGFTNNGNTCVTYPMVDPCDHTLQTNIVDVFMMDSEIEKIRIMQKSARYTILRNVTYIFIQDFSSVIRSLNASQTEAVINAPDGQTILMAGTFNNGRALTFYKEECCSQLLSNNYNDWDKNLYNNIPIWLTYGRCTNLSNCLIDINNYQSYLNQDDVILCYSQNSLNSNVDVTDPQLINKLQTGKWGIIFSGTYWAAVFQNQKNLMGLFGMCGTGSSASSANAALNQCNNIPQTVDIPCK